MKNLSPVALALCAGLAASAAADQIAMTIDSTQLLINGNSSTFNGVPFIAKKVGRVSEFYFKGDLSFSPSTQVLIRAVNINSPQNAIRIIVGNDALFPGGVDIDASGAGGGKGGSLGGSGDLAQGGAGGAAGSGVFDSAGGKSGSCFFDNGFDGHGAETSRTAPQNGGNGQTAGGTAGGDGLTGANQKVSAPTPGGAAGTPGSGSAGGTQRAPEPPSLAGAGGAGGYASGGKGEGGKQFVYDAGWGTDGGNGGPGGNGSRGLFPAPNIAVEFLQQTYPILRAGNAGSGGGGGGAGASGGGGAGGWHGGNGGGGGGTSCNDGGAGGAGGKGGKGGNGGRSGPGGSGGEGGDGGGAIEITALGRLVIGSAGGPASSASARGKDGTSGFIGVPGLSGTSGEGGTNGQPGVHVNNPAGDGGAGGPGRSGGNGGKGGNGASGGHGGGGSGGTLFFTGNELSIYNMSLDVSGGNSPGANRGDYGRGIFAGNHTNNFNLTSGLGEVASYGGIDPLQFVPTPAARGGAPYVQSAPTIPYISGLQGGSGMAGIVPGLAAKSLINAPSLGTRAVGVVLLTDQDIPGINYDKTRWNALLYLNISNGALKEPGMMVGVPQAPAGSDAVEAGPTYNPATGSYYFRLKNSTWTQAEANAQALGGHLVTIETAAENQWIHDNLWDGFALWIGLHRVGNGFEWTSGSPAPYRNWATGEPNNWEGYEPAGEMWTDGKWNDTRDDAYYEDNRGIAEVPGTGPAAPVRLKQYGWANDPRFGGIAPVDMATIPANQVYMTLVPVGMNLTQASMTGGRTVGGNTQNLTAQTSSFGLGANSMLVLRTPCFGDFNADDLVDDSDFQTFVLGYNKLDCEDPTMTPGCPADMNRDGAVDDFDFQIFVVAYDKLLCP